MTIDLDMAAERLIHYLENPKNLHDITYQELKNWSNLFPFCQNLRYLVVQKSKMDHQQEYPKDLELAATYSIDRSLLHLQIELNHFKYDDAENFINLVDDTLDLQDLPEREVVELDQVQPAASMPPSDNFEFIIPDVAAPEPTLDLPIQEDLMDSESNLEFEDDENFDSEIPKESLSNEKEPYELTIIERLLSNESKENALEVPVDKIETEENIIEEVVEANALPDIDTPVLELENEITDTEDDLIDFILNTQTDDDVETPDLTLNEDVELPVETPVAILAPKILEEVFPIIEEPTIEEEEEIIVEDISSPTEVEVSDNLTENIDQESATEFHLSDSSSDSDAPVEIQEIEVPLPVSKRSFSSWLKNYQNSKPIFDKIKPLPTNKDVPNLPSDEKKKKEQHTEPSERNKKIKKLIKSNKKKIKVKKKKKAKGKETDLANKSIMDSEEIISQTLADLLAVQGYSDKAIKMYERLSLIFPEKSSFFANKIKELSYFEE